MALEVDGSTLLKALGCSKGHGCLEDEGRSLCTAVQLVEWEFDDVVFVQRGDDRPCPFKVECGTGGHCVCMCPVRAEIFKRYGK